MKTEKDDTNRQKHSHFIAYVRWDILLEWKAGEIAAQRLSKNLHLKPYAYGTRAVGLKEKFQYGDTLWIFSIPRFGKYASFPTLVAQLEVNKVIDLNSETNPENTAMVPEFIKNYKDKKTGRHWNFVILGEKSTSRYFPINNVFDLISTHFLEGKSNESVNRIYNGKYGYIAQFFQKTRRLPDESQNGFIKKAETISGSPSVFISYRHKYSSPVARRLAEALLKVNINCWLDLNRMPQKLPAELQILAEQYFNNEIQRAIEDCTVFIALKSIDYDLRKWTKKEFSIAKKIKNDKLIETDNKCLKDKIVFDNILSKVKHFLKEV